MSQDIKWISKHLWPICKVTTERDKWFLSLPDMLEWKKPPSSAFRAAHIVDKSKVKGGQGRNPGDTNGSSCSNLVRPCRSGTGRLSRWGRAQALAMATFQSPTTTQGVPTSSSESQVLWEPGVPTRLSHDTYLQRTFIYEVLPIRGSEILSIYSKWNVNLTNANLKNDKKWKNKHHPHRSTDTNINDQWFLQGPQSHCRHLTQKIHPGVVLLCSCLYKFKLVLKFGNNDMIILCIYLFLIFLLVHKPYKILGFILT